MRSDIIDRLKLLSEMQDVYTEAKLLEEAIETIESLRDEICRLESLVGELERNASLGALGNRGPKLQRN